MAVFSAAGESDFVQDMMLLAVRNASLVEAFKEYIQMRNEFRSIGPHPSGFDGQIGSVLLTAQEAEQYKPYIIPPNSVALGLEAGLEKDTQLAKMVAAKFGLVCQRYFNDPTFTSLTFLSARRLRG